MPASDRAPSPTSGVGEGVGWCGIRLGWVALLVLTHVALATASSLRKSDGADESHFIGLGWYIVRTGGDFNTENWHPPLSYYWGSLGIPFLGLDDGVWTNRVELRYGAVRYTEIAQQILHEGGRDPATVLLVSRLPFIALSGLLGLFVYRWSRRLHGDRGGLISLATYTFCPLMLSHAQLVIVDVFHAFWFFLSVYAFWAYARQPSWRRFLGTCLLVAITGGSRHTFLSLGPIFALLMGWELLRRREIRPPLARPAWLVGGRFRRTAVLGGLFAVVVPVLMFAILWPAYWFHVARPMRFEDRPHRNVDRKLPEGPIRDLGYAVLEAPIPASEYLGAFIGAVVHGELGHPSFIHGHRSRHAPWYFYPVAMAMKTPLATIALVALGVLWPIRGWKGPSGGVFLLAAILVVVVGSFGLPLKIAIRYVLQAYPFLAVLAGRIGRVEAPGRILRMATGGLVTWLVVSVLLVHPHYLAYFNALAGGPARGREWFVDSNLEWGQDLPILVEAGDHLGVGEFELVHHWQSRPARWGVPSRPADPDGLRSGVYAATATDLSGTYWNGTRFQWLDDRTDLLHVGYAYWVFEVGGPEGRR